MTIEKGKIMRRMYLSKIQGDGSIENPFRHQFQISHPNVEYKGGEIETDVGGHPVAKALLIIVGAIDHRPFQATEGLVPIPDMSMADKISGINVPEKITCKTRLKTEIGFTDVELATIWEDGSDSMRSLLNAYGRHNNSDFDVNNFDLTDL